LHATDLFDLTEFGSFGQFDDVRALDLPWRFISALPDPDKPDEVARYESNPLYKFGAWKLEEALLNVKPDIVLSWRDFWMDECIFRSPFRKFYHYSHMPTVDAAPLNLQWVASYLEADAVFAYTDWGLETLRQEGGGRIKTKCSAPPGADTEVFRPRGDRESLKRLIGLPEGALVVGTVMRNMKRKLYPDLCEAFAMFLREAPEDIRNRTYLYLHTCYPDLGGWDIPRLIKDNGIGHRVLVTYICRSCGEAFPCPFSDALTHCRSCGKSTAVMPDSGAGVSRETLSKIYNIFDCYVQYSSNEGMGMPAVEAAACEVPVMEVDYSAMSDVVRKLHGVPIKVQRFYREAETYRLFAMPDQDDFVSKLSHLLSLPEVIRRRMGWQARKGVLEHYTYDRTAKIWADHLLSVPLRDHSVTWDSPPRYHEPNTRIPDGLSNEEWVRWCFVNVLGRPDLVDSYAAVRMTRDLNWRTTTGGMGGFIYNDASALGLEVETRRTAFDRQAALDQMLNTVGEWNYWERRRCMFRQTDSVGVSSAHSEVRI
jgi:glycosyltransferase involved in cell wall biosynthesis